jgi:predicted small secreted protein
MNLITTYYTSSNTERLNEINLCLQKNIENKYIKKIILLNNEIFPLDFLNDPFKKIIQVKISNNESYKLKFNDSVKYINEYCKDEICILANSDIYFNESLFKINRFNISNKMFSLLRYDLKEDNSLEIFKNFDTPRNDSQDSWIFMSPMNISYDLIDFEFGTLGCDNMFSSIVYNTGLTITNPCYDIVSIHVHKSNYRTYNENSRIHGNYLFIDPTNINENSKIHFQLY